MDHFQHHVQFLLTSVVTSTCQCYPGELLLKGRLHRMAVISNVQYLRPEQEEQIEQVKICIGFLSLMEAMLRMPSPQSNIKRD